MAAISIEQLRLSIRGAILQAGDAGEKRIQEGGPRARPFLSASAGLDSVLMFHRNEIYPVKRSR